MADEEINQEEVKSFVRKVLEKLNRILHRYMSGFGKYDQLKEFMKDEKNLYNEDGSLTEEYKRRIAEVEGYVEGHSIDEAVKAEVVHTQFDQEVYQGIVDFINYRWAFIKEFDKAEDREGSNFNAEKFLKAYVERNSSSEEERRNIIDAMNQIASEDALEELQDENVRRALKDMINDTEEEEEY